MRTASPIIIEPKQGAANVSIEFPMHRTGMVQKCDIRTVINLCDASFRKHVQAACDSDASFYARYEPWRRKKFIPINLGAELIVGIVGDARLVFVPEKETNYAKLKRGNSGTKAQHPVG